MLRKEFFENDQKPKDQRKPKCNKKELLLSYGYNGQKSEPKIGKLEKKWLQCNRKSEAEKRNRKSENGNVVTMSDFPIFGPVFRKIGFFGKCGYNERFLAPIFGKPEIFSDRIFRSDFFIGFRFFEMC